MGKRYVSFIIALIFCASSGVCLAQTDAQFTLDECLRVLLDDENAPQLVEHDFQLILPGEATPRVNVGLNGTLLVYLASPRLAMEQSPTDGRLEMIFNDDRPRRALLPSERRGLRWYLSLNPFWVLHEVRNRIAEFDYYADQEAGYGYFTYEKMVSLADPSQQRYGLYREELVIDLVSYTMVSYSMQAQTPSGRAVQDLYNQYTYPSTPGPTMITVSQGPLNLSKGGRSFRVLLSAKGGVQ